MVRVLAGAILIGASQQEALGDQGTGSGSIDNRSASFRRNLQRVRATRSPAAARSCAEKHQTRRPRADMRLRNAEGASVAI